MLGMAGDDMTVLVRAAAYLSERGSYAEKR
jgi:hypothetical protein